MQHLMRAAQLPCCPCIRTWRTLSPLVRLGSRDGVVAGAAPRAAGGGGSGGGAARQFATEGAASDGAGRRRPAPRWDDEDGGGRGSRAGGRGRGAGGAAGRAGRGGRAPGGAGRGGGGARGERGEWERTEPRAFRQQQHDDRRPGPRQQQRREQEQPGEQQQQQPKRVRFADDAPGGGGTGYGAPAGAEADGATSDGVPQATFVPRDPRVTDGPWSKVDASLVTAAQADAARAAAAAAAPEKPGGAEGAVLLGQSCDQLKALLQGLGQPAFRGQQVYDLLMKAARDPVARGARSVSEMHTLPQPVRDQLEGLGVVTGRSVVHHSVSSPCGTRKLLLQLAEGRLIETVGIPVEREGARRLTVCVSSQVGCPMRCTFCATGKGGFARNLRAHEILDQVMTVQEEYGQRVTNVVFMGMGEPLLNLPAVAAAYHLLHDGLGLSGRAITISTVGVPNAIRKLAAMRLPVTLAVSIHAPNQELRERLIPSAKVYPLEALMQDCSAYFYATKRRVTFEYTLMAGVNDQPAHARELATLLRAHRLASHVNVIPWNPVDESEYQRPSNTAVSAFRGVLEGAGIPTSLRVTRGLEAAAACGQLRNSFQKAAVPEPRQLR